VASSLQNADGMRSKLLGCILVAAGCAASHEPAKLDAADYQLAVEMNTPATLDVLAQDTGVADDAALVLSTPPTHGSATIASDGTLTFTPSLGYLGDDSLTYTVKNPDGTLAVGGVAITVGCSTCAIGVTITLSWNPNPPSDGVTGYHVFMGSSTDTSMMMQIDDVQVTRQGFDPTMPEVTYDAWTDLHLDLGDNVCFALTAYNMNGESTFSNAACTTVMHGHLRVGVGG